MKVVDYQRHLPGVDSADCDLELHCDDDQLGVVNHG